MTVKELVVLLQALPEEDKKLDVTYDGGYGRINSAKKIEPDEYYRKKYPEHPILYVIELD